MLTRKCLAALALCTLTLAATAQAEVKKVTSIEGISEFTLDNGMPVLLFPDASKPTVTVNLTVFVGSRHEGYGEAGMAHLLEHMLFKGTPTNADIPQLLKDRGASFNGTTWLDRTNYYETMPASEENLDFALQLEADRMINSKIDNSDLQSEFSVVRNEFERGENSPTRVLMQRMTSAAFLWHNYGNSTIGNRADIERVPIDNLKSFYRRYYQPDNAMLVIAGKFDEEKALAMANKHFGSIPVPERNLDKTYTVEPEQDGERLVTLRRVGDVAAVGAVYHIPAGGHPHFAAVDVLESMLNSEPAGRLYKELVEKKRASVVYGGAFATHDPGTLILLAEVNPGNEPQDVLTSLLDVTESFGESEIKDEDVQRAKQKLLKQRELAAANSTQIAIQLSEWAAQGDWRLYFIYRDQLEKVDAKQVREAASAYLKRNNRTAGMYIPTKKADRVSIPPTPNLAELIGDYKGRKVAAAGEAFDVSPENIEERTTRLTINDDLRVTLLPKKTRGEAVVLRLTLRYGNLKSLTDHTTATEFLPTMMTRGTQNLTRQQLQDALDKNFATLSGSGGSGTATFSIKTKRAQLPVAIDLLRQVLREPKFDATELDLLKNETATGLEQSLTEPTALAQRAALKHTAPYPKGHPHYVPTVKEEIEMVKAVSQAELKSLYEDLLGASHGELSIVGDFDPEATMTQMRSVLGGWKTGLPWEHVGRKGNIKLTAKHEKIDTPDKANSMYFAVSVFPMKDDAAEYPALLMGNYILGGGALANRLGNRVRQKEGLSYGVRSGLSVGSLDNRTLFYIYAISNPHNVPKVIKAIDEEVKLLLDKGVTEDELAAARKGWLQSQQVSRGNDSSLASTLASTARTGRTMEHYSGLEQKIRSVTTEQVLEALRKRIDPKHIVLVTAGDPNPPPPSSPPKQ